MLMCEAAGFDVIIVETVGVGQSETAVAGMCDVFVLLQLPNAGDELQGIKKGILELADIVVYNKADIDPRAAAVAAGQMRAALHMLRPASPHWQMQVLQASASTGAGIEEVWAMLQNYRKAMQQAGAFEERRKHQAAGLDVATGGSRPAGALPQPRRRARRPAASLAAGRRRPDQPGHAGLTAAGRLPPLRRSRYHESSPTDQPNTPQ
jgi:LAO/AO transport system kinase